MIDRVKIDLTIVHPFLFALYPALTFYASNMDHTSPLIPWLTIVVIGLLTLLFLVCVNLILNNQAKSGIFTSIFVFLFFTYGHVHGALLRVYEKTHVFTAIFENLDSGAKFDYILHWPLSVVFIVLFISSLIFLFFSKKEIHENITKILNFISFTLIVLCVINIFRFSSPNPEQPISNTFEGKAYHAPEIKPDIYYIILDGYGRNDVLEAYFDFSNHRFSAFLKENNFALIDQGNANYTWTFLSLPSSLNFTYINHLTDLVGKDSKDLNIPFEMIKNNKVAQFLKTFGYQYIHFNSTWGATLNNAYADKEIGYKKNVFANEYLRVLAETTFLKMLDSTVTENLAKFYLYSFKMLKTIPDIQEPTFTLAHFIIPHYPYIFNQEGEVISKSTRYNQFKHSLWNAKQAYINQLIFVNKKIEEIVEDILRKSETEPIIIIQSDHGPRVYKKGNRELGDTENHQVRMANFNAIFVPNNKKEIFHPTLTPVNTFRIIFNEFFNADFELLKDKVYYSDFNTPYQFREIEPFTKNAIQSEQ